MSLNIEALRREFPVTERVVYLNTGTAGVCPLSVAERLWESERAFELDGEFGWGAASERMEAGRRRLAAFLNADPDEIAFTRNATDGVNIVVEGVQWRDGDEILLSDEEHPAMLFPWTFLTQRRDVALRRFKVGMTPDETLDAIHASTSPQTRLVATSHVSSVTGKRVPVKAVVRLCRERGVLSFIDGAQAIAQFPIDLAEIDADFYTGNCHKWLHGPKGTGFLRVRPDRIDELTPTHVGAGTGAFSDETGLAPRDDARRFEYGTNGFGKYGGLVPLFEWWDEIGFGAAWTRLEYLTDYLKERLRELSHVEVHTPRAWTDSSALTTFSIPGHGAGKVFNETFERHRIRLRVVGEVDGNRVSTSLFNTEAEIDLLIDALADYG